jgi:ribosome maturation factor RimP
MKIMALTEAWVQQVIDREVEGVELVMLEQVGDKRQRAVRLYIDHVGGVTLELCGRVSDAVGTALDEAEAIGEPYTLEVSSPGLERPLRKREHFESQVGKKVYVKSRVPVEGTKVWQGKLLEVTPDAVLVDGGVKQVRIQLSDISVAHLIFDFE